MTAIWMAVALLGGGPDSPSPGEQQPAPQPKVLSPAELRDAIRDAMRASRADDAEPGSVVGQLVEVYRQLDNDKLLSNRERNRLQQQLRSRMIDVGDKIFADLKRQRARQRREEAKANRAAAKAAREAATSSGRPEDYRFGDDEAEEGDDEGGAGGPGEREGEALIELIRTTIAPESWSVNGGPGTIYYYEPLKVLVVRQTSETHWLLGGLRKQLEK